ncbi:MAG: hypothetical protein U5L11_00065 [Arhodomonas sp.]|nr:hypothetical protein [Arhodomonas sp.]
MSDGTEADHPAVRDDDLRHLGLAAIEGGGHRGTGPGRPAGHRLRPRLPRHARLRGPRGGAGDGSGVASGAVAATLASTGTPAFFVHPGEAGHGDLGNASPPGTWWLALSNSGETDEITHHCCR